MAGQRSAVGRESEIDKIWQDNGLIEDREEIQARPNSR